MEEGVQYNNKVIPLFNPSKCILLKPERDAGVHHG